MIIHIIPVKFSNTLLLSAIRGELLQYFSKLKRGQCRNDVNIINNELNIDEAFSSQREQYFSTRVIAEVSAKTNGFNGKVLIITDVDLYIPVLTYVFGEAQLNGKHSVVSVCRLHEEFYSGKTDEELLKVRTMKEVLHELGHSFGLLHCLDWDCVMHSSTSIEEVDIKGSSYCKNCKDRVIYNFSYN